MRFHQLEEALLQARVVQLFSAEVITPCITNLRQSIKFYGGEAELVPQKSVETMPNFPFPTIAVEFEESGGHWIDVLGEEGKLWASVSFEKFAKQGWVPIGYTGGDRSTSRLALGLYDGFLKMLNEDTEARRTELIDILAKRANLMARFLSVLNCVNVRTEIVEPGARLNKKRALGGKPPIYSYKVLVLRQGKQHMNLGGTHESPPIHLRRGHIKRRKTGNFWWQPCVVGDRKKGVVMKDYRADKLSPRSLDG
jgi:hypothetical protein